MDEEEFSTNSKMTSVNDGTITSNSSSMNLVNSVSSCPTNRRHLFKVVKIVSTEEDDKDGECSELLINSGQQKPEVVTAPKSDLFAPNEVEEEEGEESFRDYETEGSNGQSAYTTLYSLDSASKQLLSFSSNGMFGCSQCSTANNSCHSCNKCHHRSRQAVPNSITHRDSRVNGSSYDKNQEDEEDDAQSSENQSRTFTISRMTYNLSEFDATFRDANKQMSLDRSQSIGAKMFTGNGWLAKQKAKCGATDARVMIGDKDSQPSLLLTILTQYLPIIGWLQSYDWKRDLNHDIFAGITIAVFQIPQCMGYSLLAKVPPIYGLYSSFIAPIFYAILGTSKHASVGTFAIISLMTGSIISDLSQKPWFVPGQSEIQIATAIAFVIGVYQMAFAICQFGFLAQFMSEQLTSGFITASAFYVFSSQLGYITGIESVQSSGTGMFSLIQFYCNFIPATQTETNPVTFAISAACIVLLGFYKLYLLEVFSRSKRPWVNRLKVLPSELILVVTFVLLSWGFDLKNRYGVKILGSVPVGLPSFTDLDYRLVLQEQLWVSCIPLAIVAFAVTYSTGVTFATKHGYEVVPNQELLALGVTNTISSFFLCIPTAASLSRSALQESIGARTQLTGLVNSVCILVVLLFLSPLLSYLPKCVLASIICVALKSLFMKAVDFKKYCKLDKLDGSIWIVSFLSVLVFNVDIGLYIGLGYSLLTLISKSRRPKVYLLGAVGSTNVYVPTVHYPRANELDSIKIYQFCGPLHFANVDYFKRKLAEKVQNKMIYSHSDHQTRNQNLPCVIIIDCSMFSYIDATGITTVRNLVNRYESLGARVLLCGVAAHVARMMEADRNFGQDVPTSKIFISVHDAVHRALEEMKQQQRRERQLRQLQQSCPQQSLPQFDNDSERSVVVESDNQKIKQCGPMLLEQNLQPTRDPFHCSSREVITPKVKKKSISFDAGIDRCGCQQPPPQQQHRTRPVLDYGHLNRRTDLAGIGEDRQILIHMEQNADPIV